MLRIRLFAGLVCAGLSLGLFPHAAGAVEGAGAPGPATQPFGPPAPDAAELRRSKPAQLSESLSAAPKAGDPEGAARPGEDIRVVSNGRPPSAAPAPAQNPPAPRVINIGPAGPGRPQAQDAALELVRVWLAPSGVGFGCVGEFAVRNTGPDIAPDPVRDLFRAEIEIRTAGGASLFRNHVSRVGTGIGRGEIVACKFDTQYNAGKPSGPGGFPRFVIPASGEYVLAVTLFCNGDPRPLDAHVETFKVAEPVPRPPAPARGPGQGPLRIAQVTVEPATAGQLCTGEYEVRNDGPDIPPGREDLFSSTVEILDPAGNTVYRGGISRSGTGIGRGEVVNVKWSTNLNMLDRGPGGGFRPFPLPAAGKYVARVTLMRNLPGPAVDVRDTRFLAAAPVASAQPVVPAGPAPLPAVPTPAPRPPAPSAKPPAVNPRWAPPVPPAFQIVPPRVVNPAAAGQRLSGRFFVRNNGPFYLTPPGGPAPGWDVAVLDENERVIFQTSGTWGPGLDRDECIEINWDSSSNEVAGRLGAPFVLPRTGQYRVRIGIYPATEVRNGWVDAWTIPLPVGSAAR